MPLYWSPIELFSYEMGIKMKSTPRYFRKKMVSVLQSKLGKLVKYWFLFLSKLLRQLSHFKILIITPIMMLCHPYWPHCSSPQVCMYWQCKDKFILIVPSKYGPVITMTPGWNYPQAVWFIIQLALGYLWIYDSIKISKERSHFDQ